MCDKSQESEEFGDGEGGLLRGAVREATARSQLATNWQPAAVAIACTAAITGCGMVTICCIMALHVVMMCLK